MKEVKTQNIWNFELGTEEGINIPIWVVIAFQQRERQDSQNLNVDTFYRPPVTSAQCFIGNEKYTDSGILFYYDKEGYFQGYGKIREAFKALTKDNIVQPYISDNDVRSSNNNNDIGFNLYVFDIPHQKNLESAQPIELQFSFSKNIDAGVYGYALVLTNELVSI